MPTFTTQQDMDAPISVAHARCRNLLDAGGQLSLPGSTGAIMVGRTVDRQCAASTSNAHLPGRPRMIYQLTPPGRLQS
jgi:hypothetical protein